MQKNWWPLSFLLINFSLYLIYNSRGVWNDEILQFQSVVAADGVINVVQNALNTYKGPIDYFLSFLSGNFFGIHKLSVKLHAMILSVTFFSILPILLYYTFKNKTLTLLGTSFYFLNTIVLYYTTEGRPYILVVILSTFWIFQIFYFLRNPQRFNWSAFALTQFLLLFTASYQQILFFAAVNLTFLYFAKNIHKIFVQKWIKINLLIFLIYLPYFAHILLNATEFNLYSLSKGLQLNNPLDLLIWSRLGLYFTPSLLVVGFYGLFVFLFKDKVFNLNIYSRYLLTVSFLFVILSELSTILFFNIPIGFRHIIIINPLIIFSVLFLSYNSLSATKFIFKKTLILIIFLSVYYISSDFTKSLYEGVDSPWRVSDHVYKYLAKNASRKDILVKFNFGYPNELLPNEFFEKRIYFTEENSPQFVDTSGEVGFGCYHGQVISKNLFLEDSNQKIFIVFDSKSDQVDLLKFADQNNEVFFNEIDKKWILELRPTVGSSLNLYKQFLKNVSNSFNNLSNSSALEQLFYYYKLEGDALMMKEIKNHFSKLAYSDTQENKFETNIKFLVNLGIKKRIDCFGTLIDQMPKNN